MLPIISNSYWATYVYPFSCRVSTYKMTVLYNCFFCFCFLQDDIYSLHYINPTTYILSFYSILNNHTFQYSLYVLIFTYNILLTPGLLLLHLVTQTINLPSNVINIMTIIALLYPVSAYCIALQETIILKYHYFHFFYSLLHCYIFHPQQVLL
jgi:hypothetical protein